MAQKPWQEREKELREAQEAAAIAVNHVSNILMEIRQEHDWDHGLIVRINSAWQREMDWYQAVSRVRAALDPSNDRLT